MRRLSLPVFLLLVACSTGDDASKDSSSDTDASDDPGNNAALTTEERFVQQAGYAACEIYRECSEEIALQAYSYDDCIAAVDLSISFWPYNNCSYDAQRASDCLDYYDSWTDCDNDGSGEPESCDDVWDCP